MTMDSPATHTAAPHEKRTDIQGMRALAVLGVIVFHAAAGLLPGGFVGVDVFFVLSGFLITGILMRAMDAGQFSLRAFYGRRVRRLFPALFVVLAASLVLGWFILPPLGLEELAFTQFFTNLFLSNLAFIRISGYFDADASLRPLLHTWSLGVEEQFYLLFPPILALLHRFARRLLWPAIGLMALASLWSAQGYLQTNPTAAFYHPFSRAMELLVGAAAYGVTRHFTPSGVLRTILSVGGLVTVLASMVLINGDTPFPGLWALVPCLGTAALLIAPGGPAAKALGLPPLVAIGDMSYSLYLWHWPLLVYGHLALGLSVPVTIGAVVLTFVFGWLSRRYVEEPFLGDRKWPVLWMALGATAVSIGICVAIYNAKGVPQRFNAEERAIFAGAEDFNPDRKRCHKRSNGTLPYDQTCTYGAASAPPSVAIWADSIGAEISPVLGEALKVEGRSLRSITASGCPAMIGDGDANCEGHNRQILTGLIADPAMQTVILTANYLGYDREPDSDMPESMLKAAAALRAAGKQVIIILPLPAYAFDPPSEAGLALRFGRDPRDVGMTTADYDRLNGPTLARIQAFAAANGIQTVSARELLCDAERCRLYDPVEGMLYYNDVHLSLTGAKKFADRLMGLMVVVDAGVIS